MCFVIQGLKDPVSWSSYISPWVVDLMILPVSTAMIINALFDILVGLLLLFDIYSWLAGILVAVHIFVVLSVSGINSITVRDIAILAAGIAVFITDNRWQFKKNNKIIK